MEYQDFKDSFFYMMNPAEQMFIEEIYHPLLGSEALDYVRPQMPFRDSKGIMRKIDFAVSHF